MFNKILVPCVLASDKKAKKVKKYEAAQQHGPHTDTKGLYFKIQPIGLWPPGFILYKNLWIL